MAENPSHFWQTDRSLSLLLGLLCILLFVVPPLTESGVVGSHWIASFLSLVLLAGTIRASREQRLRSLVILSATISFVAHWIAFFAPSFAAVVFDNVMLFLTFFLFAASIMREVFRAGEITMHRVFGAAAVYLLLGAMWTFAYHLVYLSIPGSIRFAELPATQSVMPKLLYFSFITLTTVGYGDITAVHPLARALVIGEALIGQLFPAILIGALASMAVHSRHSN